MATGQSLNGTVNKEEGFSAHAMSLVENAPVNIMCADKDLVITYLNPASRKKLEELAQYLPVPVEEVVGSSIDIFHKNPEHQRKLLSKPKNLPLETEIQIGPETATLLVSPVYNGDEYVGPMVTWEVVTEKLKLEREQSRISSDTGVCMGNLPAGPVNKLSTGQQR